MSRLLCCCSKKNKAKEINALKPQYSHVPVDPNDYVYENVCIVKVPQQNTGKDEYRGRILKKHLVTGNDLSSSEILIKQLPRRVSTREIKSYPCSPKEQEDDKLYFSETALNSDTKSREMFTEIPENSQEVYTTKTNYFKSAFRKEVGERMEARTSVKYEKTCSESFPFKMTIGERKFTSLIYDHPPIEIVDNVKKRVQRRQLESLTERPKPHLYCDFVINESSDGQSSSEDSLTKHQQTNKSKPSYIMHSPDTNVDKINKLQYETSYDKKETKNINVEKQLENYERNPELNNQQIYTEEIPVKEAKSPFTKKSHIDDRSVVSQKPVGRIRTTLSSHNLIGSDKLPFKAEKEFSAYLAGMPQWHKPRAKSTGTSSVNSLGRKKSAQIPRKVIRRSRDNDIFEEKIQYPVRVETAPQYINVGRGPKVRGTADELLVSDYLNQFSSMFVDNIKDPIPKDPLTRPKSYNVYVPPQSQTQGRRVPTRNVQKQPFSTGYASNRNQSVAARLTKGLQYIPKREQDDSSDLESERLPERSIRNKFISRSRRKSLPRTHNIYSALVDTVINRDEYSPRIKSTQTDDSNEFYEDSLTLYEDEKSNDETLHGLRCIGPNNISNCYTTNSNTPHETSDSDTDDGETDIFCYPTKKFLTDTITDASSSGKNKLRWKITIKRGNKNS